jgi:glycosyltransferase involved in cell wall biosynthesis
LSLEKGFSVFVEAATFLSRHDPSLGFIIFGDGPQRKPLAQQIADAGLADRIVLAGFHSNLTDDLGSVDLFVIPSFTEGLPCVLLEALVCEIPVVASAVGGIPEVLEDGLSGYLVPPGNSSALAHRILDALANEERRRGMGQKGRQRVLENYTFAVTGPIYERLFQQLAQSGRRQRGVESRDRHSSGKILISQ